MDNIKIEISIPFTERPAIQLSSGDIKERIHLTEATINKITRTLHRISQQVKKVRRIEGIS